MQRATQRLGWRSALVVGLIIATAALISTVLLLASSAAHAQGRQDEPPSPGMVRLNEVTGGALLLHSNQPGWFVLAPQVGTDIEVGVSGPLARTVVTQSFVNNSDMFVEGTYVFPLPENSAVDTLRMRVGQRWIEGRIETRRQAREIYEEAKDGGQVATLVEQHRPNAFTTEVANIAPGDEVVVQIELQQTLAPRDGAFGVRIPLVVAPRYVPDGHLAPGLELTGNGWRRVDGNPASPAPAVRATPDQSDSATPADTADSADPAEPVNPVRISIDLDAGTPLAEISSPYHQISITDQQFTSASVELVGSVPADRDFYLAWTTTALDDAHASTFVEHHRERSHYLALITPPRHESLGDEVPPREMIFVQDTSGSMAGASLAQARRGLTLALERLEPEDTFNLIDFNSTWTAFSHEPIAATERNISGATEWVSSMVSSGGTEMAPALREALRDPGLDDSRIRQVVFLTDGAVSNEDELLGIISGRLGRSRLFTVGIGSAPNSHFMRSAATLGRGASVSIGDLDEVEELMGDLFAKLEHPALVDVVVAGVPDGVEISPSPMPDLYAGEPVVVGLVVPAGVDVAEEIRMVGVRGGETVEIEVPVDKASQREGVARLWAREEIAELDDRRSSLYFTGTSDEIETQLEQLDAKVESLALEYGLVSRLTSLVAVDLEVTRPADVDAGSAEVALNVPAGWDPTGFELIQRSDGAEPAELSQELTAALDGAPTRDASGGGGVAIPKGGAGWVVRAITGTSLALVGLVGWRRGGDRRPSARWQRSLRPTP